MVMVVVVSCLLVSRIVLILADAVQESFRVERKPLEEHISDDRDRA